MKHILALTLLACLIPALVAEAHAELVKAVPEPGSVVDSGIKEIRLTFDEAIEEGSSITLFAEQFRLIPNIQAELDGADMFVPIPEALDPGEYTVQWIAVGDDGHTTQGSYQFSVRQQVSSSATWLWWLLVIPIGAGAYAVWRRARGEKRG
jgi:methionine-rich copper-binding protein CopC